MGDRCYVEIICRPRDIRRFQDLGFSVWEQQSESAVIQDEAANFAHGEDLEALAKEGLVFFGWHAPGDEYPGELFAAAKGEMAWVFGDEYGPACRMRRDGTPEPADHERVLKYWQLRGQVEVLLGISNAKDG